MSDWTSTFPVLVALMVIMILDILMGLLISFRDQKMSSSSSWIGISRKVGVLIVIALAVVLDPFVTGVSLSLVVTMFYLIPESLSIVENAGRLGIPIPSVLRDALVKLRRGD